MGVRRATSRGRLYEIMKQGKNTDSPAGDGISQAIVSNTLLRQGQEVVTEIVVDLGSSLITSSLPLSSSATLGRVLGVSSSTGTHPASRLTTLSTATNGHLIAVDMICLETPASATGSVTTDIDLVVTGSSLLGFNGDASGGTILINASGSWSQGNFKSWTTLPGSNIYALNASGNVPGDTSSLYLAYGGSGNEGAYSAGKYVIRLYGIIEPSDI